MTVFAIHHHLVARAKEITAREKVVYSERTKRSQIRTERARKVMPAGVLAPGTAIPSIQFTLNRKSFAPPGKVILLKEQLLALRFDYLSAAEKSALSKYVFKRLTS